MLPADAARVIAHELLHAMGFGSTWPTLDGCGGVDADCLDKAKAFGEYVTDNGYPEANFLGWDAFAYPYDAQRTGSCQASINFQKECAAVPQCKIDVYAGSGLELMVDTVFVPVKGPSPDGSPGSNCGHFADLQLGGEIGTSAAFVSVNFQSTATSQTHMTSVTLGAL
eukprot:TRINITY_DN8327_c0_g1_i1.p1 TRINITY_DN8327_c0_g1~~TRINITY_DN8327_c0_g1_i1.p1  ORF type:complete len:168 (-),score=6.68 TRINITY_DN8327_c0_g1_i1:379-882(-)